MSNERYQEALARRRAEGRYRQYDLLDASLVDFASNDYLGFAYTDEQFFPRNSMDGVLRVGSGAARLITGNSEVAESLEKLIADFHHSETALLTATGYAANLSVMSTLPQRGDIIFFDESVHASIRDGMQLSNAKAVKFRHNDVGHLEELLQQNEKQAFVVVESVYSMTGDLAPLVEMATLCTRFQVHLIVDEAHALGIYGPMGEGLVVAQELEDCVFCRIVTFGKSLGCFGAAILTNAVARDYLVNFARPLIYSTFIPPLMLDVIQAQYHRLFQSSSERKRLFDNIEFFEQKATELGLSLEDSQGAIRSVTIGEATRAKYLAGELQARGFLVKAICAPTVPQGQEKLRIVLHSYNTRQEIGHLLQTLVEKLTYEESDIRNRDRH